MEKVMEDFLKAVFSKLSALSDEEFKDRLEAVSDDPLTKFLNLFIASEGDSDCSVVKDFSIRTSDDIAQFLSGLLIEDFEDVSDFSAANDERFALAA